MNTYFRNTTRILNNAIESICEEEFEALVADCRKTLEAQHKIIATGLGKNVPVCEKFVGSMLSMGLDCSFMHTNSAVHGDLGMVRSGDLVIILTKSGSTAESVYLYEQLKQRDCTVWLLSFSRDSVLYHKVENHLIVDLEHEGDQWNILPNNSTTMNLIVLQGLAMALAERMHVTLGDFKPNHPGGHIGAQLKDV